MKFTITAERQLLGKGTSVELCERLLRYDLGKLDLQDLQCYSLEQNLPQASSNTKEQHIDQICKLMMKDREEKENKKTALTGKRKESEPKEKNTPSKKEKKAKKQKADAQPQMNTFGELLDIYAEKDLQIVDLRKLCAEAAEISKKIAQKELMLNVLDNEIAARRGKFAGV